MRFTISLLSAVFLITVAHVPFAQRTTPVIRQADHILVESSDPSELFSLFSDTLEFPIAWPISENQGYVTGGVGVGNVNLELYRYAETKGISASNTPAARFAGIAFEPYPLADALRRLQSLNIPHSAPESSVATLPGGKQGIAWTTVGLPSVSSPLMSIFLYEYSPAFLRVDVRRRQLGNRLTLNKGGPLGLLDTSEIIISTSNLKRDMDNWGRLLGKSAGQDRWRAIGGPVIRLASGEEDGIRGIALRVKSLGHAKTFLRENSLLGTGSGSRIYLSPSKVQGLMISLIEQ